MERLVGNFTIRMPVGKTPRYNKQLISEEITQNVMNLNAQFTQEDTERLIPLSPPPNRTYATRQAAQDALLKWSRLLGYAYRLLRSKKSKHKDKANQYTVCFYMFCDMELIHNSTATICKTSSRGVGCLHRAKVINKTRTTDDDDTAKREVFVEIARHVKVSETGATPPASTHQIYIAHEASLSPSSHPAHRKRNQEQLLKLRSLFDQGLESKRVWTVFREDSKGVPHVTQQDIYAERAGYPSEKLAGRTSTQALLDELQEDVDWWYRYHTGLLGNITTLFFTH
ncbi:hypothetical protein K3495_g16046, partial [Podosphaera aphanis]